MKLQLDTINKTITIEESINLDDFVTNLEELLPDGRWKEFTLLIAPIINWNPNPIIIDRYPVIQPPSYPWNTPVITCDGR